MIAEHKPRYKMDQVPGLERGLRARTILDLTVRDYNMIADAYLSVMPKHDKKAFAKTNTLYKELVGKVIQSLPLVLSPRCMAILADAPTRARLTHTHNHIM